MEESRSAQGLMDLSSPAPVAMGGSGVGAAQRQKIFRLTLFCLVIMVFLGLRFLTSPPARDWSDLPELSPFTETIAPEAQHPVFYLVGLVLALMALGLNRPLGFAFLLCDMAGFGQYFDLDQWGLVGWFKFRDLEFLLLLTVGIILDIYTPRAQREPSALFRRWLFRVGLAIPALWVLYTLATLPAQPLLITLRYTRQFGVWLLLLVVPQFIRNERELKQVVGMMLFLILLTSVLYLLQTILPPFTVLRYAQQMYALGSEEQIRIWTGISSIVYLGGCAIFAYLMKEQKTSWTLALLWGLCFLTVISILGRVLLAAFLGSTILIFLVSLKGESKTPKILRLGAILLGVMLVIGFFLFYLGRFEQLTEGWLWRLWELQDEYAYGGKGSFAGRLEMLTYLPSVMERNGGSLLNALVGMGLLALTPEQLSPMIFWGEVSPPFWADNGLAGLLFATGWLGLILFLAFIVLMERQLLRGLRRAQGPLARSLLLTAMVYLAFAPFYMFFSSLFLGGWDEALMLVMGLALAERALTLEQPQRIIIERRT